MLTENQKQILLQKAEEMLEYKNLEKGQNEECEIVYVPIVITKRGDKIMSYSSNYNNVL